MKGDPVSPEHFIARHCSRFNDIIYQHGQAVGIYETAFMPRPSDDDGISVEWVDFFQGNRQHALNCVRSITKLHVRDTHRIALLQVRDLLIAAAPIAALYIIQDPDENLPPDFNAAHSLIRETADLNNVFLRQRLATLVKPGDLYPYR